MERSAYGLEEVQEVWVGRLSIFLLSVGICNVDGRGVGFQRPCGLSVESWVPGCGIERG